MKIVKQGKVLTSEALNAEMILNENQRKANEDARNVWEQYDNTKQYIKGNKVAFNGSSYLCKATCRGILPTDINYWMMIASAGAGLENATQLPIIDTGNYYTTNDTNSALQEVGQKLNEHDTKIGDLSQLNTTSNTDLVGGINENKGSIDTIKEDIGDLIQNGSLNQLQVNAVSNDYGGAISEAHIKNTDGNVTLTLQHNETSTNANPLDTMRIYRTVSSKGGSARQQGGLIVRDTVNADCDHNEFGYFSVLDNYSTSPTEHVGIYSQANSMASATVPLWGGCFEVRNTKPDGSGSTVDHVLTGLEIDVVNKNAFSDTQKKIGVECIAFGGGENTEAFSVYAANNTMGNGTYNTGHWRNGLKLYQNSINDTLGIGIHIDSKQGTGILITKSSANYAINIQADAPTTTGINIGANYTNPIAIQANKKIKLNGEANIQGIYWDSINNAVTFTGAAIGVANHTNFNSASAGGTQTVPVSVSGYIGIYVNGFLKKIPYFNE